MTKPRENKEINEIVKGSGDGKSIFRRGQIFAQYARYQPESGSVDSR